MSAKGSQGKPLYYVYALTDAARPARFRSGKRTLHALEVKGVAAIVEAVRERPPATEETLREQHATVTRLARRFDALLPVRFGAVFARHDLAARMQSDHDVMRRALDRVRGRVQMTIRLHGAPPAPLPRDASGTAWLVARTERDRLLRRAAAQVRRAVSPFVEEERIDPGKGELQGTVYHLVKSQHVERYTSAITAVALALAPIRLTVTGPWPVFAFGPELGRSRSRSRGSRGSGGSRGSRGSRRR
jgi:hypothetical protein